MPCGSVCHRPSSTRLAALASPGRPNLQATRTQKRDSNGAVLETTVRALGGTKPGPEHTRKTTEKSAVGLPPQLLPEKQKSSPKPAASNCRGNANGRPRSPPTCDETAELHGIEANCSSTLSSRGPTQQKHLINGGCLPVTLTLSSPVGSDLTRIVNTRFPNRTRK
jgi:hypothetical protein